MKTPALPAALLAALVSTALAAESEWVKHGPDGKLVYKTTPAGDRIMDFSHAGYMGGGVPIPDVAVKATVKPSGGADDTKLIQAAIDEVAKLPADDKGIRGAVLLAPGAFNCPSTISIATSGVVLRGSGAIGDQRSTIKMTGEPHLALAVRRGGGRGSRQSATRAADAFTTHVTDAYVPSGATTFSVSDAGGFAVGDTIEIRRPVTEPWIRFMQMHDMSRNGKPQTWIKAGSTTDHERQVAAIDGKRITIDVPLPDSFDSTYLDPPGTVVAKITPPQRPSQIGIENLHIESPLQEISHSQDHHYALRMSGEDCWVRDVVIDETMNSVSVGGSRRVTLQRVSINRKAKHQGASKPAEFAPNGTQVLLDRCTVAADNVWFVATGGGVSGPIVILNCTFTGNGRAESHQRWSTGMLYDNVRVPGGAIELRNRGSMGSGHGWSMGWGVVWNCVAGHYIVQNPPGAMNWLIGSIGDNKPSPRPFGSGPNMPEGVIDSAGQPVTPRSLYLTQLKERLGGQALKNFGYDSADDIEPVQPAARASHEPQADLAIDRPVSTSNVRGGERRFAGWNALDGDDATCWATDDGTTNATLELDTEGAVDVNVVEIGEADGLENRVRGYKVEGFVDSDWRLLSQGTSIGAKKRDGFPKVTVWKLRLTILDASNAPAVKTFSLYLQPTSASGDPQP